MNAKYLFVTLAAPIALAAAPAAQATTFVLNLTGANVATFSVDSALLAPPAESGSDYFLVENIAGVFNGVGRTADPITFSTQSSDGGFTLQFGDAFLG